MKVSWSKQTNTSSVSLNFPYNGNNVCVILGNLTLENLSDALKFEGVRMASLFERGIVPPSIDYRHYDNRRKISVRNRKHV